MEDIREKAEELLSDIEIKTEYFFEDDYEITEPIEELMDYIEKADRSYKLALEDPEIYLRLSLICFSNEKLDKAEAWVKKSLRLKNSFLGFLLKGRILQKKNDYKGAIGQYDEALKYNERRIVYQYKSQALRDRGMLDRAIEAINRALEMEESPKLLAEKADLLVDLDRVEEAKKFYEKAEELTPDIKNKERKIEELMEKAEKKLIPDIYEKILRLDKNIPEAWLGKAECYWEINDDQKAKETMETALEYVEDYRISDKLKDYREVSNLTLDCPDCGGDGTCSNCGGTGDCLNCKGSSDCPDCEEAAICFDCEGSGNCHNCDGKGKTGWFSKCDICSGTGICQTCEGYGHCITCDGTGDCQRCGGNGNCKKCQGSGTCKTCEGKGVKLD